MIKDIKGLEKLNATISAQLKPFGITKASYNNEYAYYYTEESITYQLTQNSIDDILFVEFLKDRFDVETDFPFLLFLLHEVGHHKTMDDISDEIYDFCYAEKNRIEKEISNTENLTIITKLENQYFNLPDEIMATQWAVNYYKSHPRKMEKMKKACLNALSEFFKTNLTKEDYEEWVRG